MPDAFQAEFTGERVIPGQVDDNLFNEHLARYRFTARLIRELGLQGAFLDAGCGAGYGAAELAQSGAEVLGIDVSPEAVDHARANYAAGSNLRFEQSSCTAIPTGDAAFHLVTAFEVIEHLADWRDFLAEVRRVLDPAGMFLVSTPNRLYYAESRQKAGPNPFHVHEFTEDEFRAELAAVFPHVKILLQNHVEGIAFSGADAQGSALEIKERGGDPASAHFFLAICGKQPLPPIASFVFIPDAGNVLQTRERHIALLDGEIRQKNQWIESEKAARDRMMEKVGTLETELEEHNRWAAQANQEAERRARLVTELQEELGKSNAWAQARDAEAVERGKRVEQLQAEVEQATAWAQDLDAKIAQVNDWAKSRDAEAEERGDRIVQLQDELAREQENSIAALRELSTHLEQTTAGYEAAIAQWRKEKEASDRWALETERRLSAERDAAREAFAGKQIEFEIAQERIATLQGDVEQLRAQLAEAQRRTDMIAQSRWVRLGRTFRVGPEITRN